MFKPHFHAAYHHMWKEPKKMDDPQVARAAFISSNIDFDRLFARLQQADVKARLLELTQDAVNRGGKEMFFGKDQLRDVEEPIVAAQPPSERQREQVQA